MAASKKKPALSPAAAKILEQYRSSGQPKPGNDQQDPQQAKNQPQDKQPDNPARKRSCRERLNP